MSPFKSVDRARGHPVPETPDPSGTHEPHVQRPIRWMATVPSAVLSNPPATRIVSSGMTYGYTMSELGRRPLGTNALHAPPSQRPSGPAVKSFRRPTITLPLGDGMAASDMGSPSCPGAGLDQL